MEHMETLTSVWTRRDAVALAALLSGHWRVLLVGLVVSPLIRRRRWFSSHTQTSSGSSQIVSRVAS